MTYSVEPFTYSRQFHAFGLMATRTIPVHTPRRGFPLCHMQDSSVAGIWPRGEAEECYGLGCSRATHRTSTFHAAPERRQTALPCPVTRNRARFPRIAGYCVKVLNAANRHSVGETPVQVLKSEKAALFLSRASP